jgi:AraC-like DNA-binding protein
MKTFNKNTKTVTVENLQIQVFFDKDAPLPPKGELSFERQLHDHVFVELFACLKGSITLHTHDGDTVLQAGDVAMVPPAVKHFKAPKTTPDTKWAGFGFVCRKSADTENDIYGQCNRWTYGDKVFCYTDMKACEAAAECYDRRGEGEIGSVLCLVAALLPLAAQTDGTARRHPTDPPKDVERLLQLDDILHQCTGQDFSQKEIAQMLFISERQLFRIAQKYYGMSLKEKITQRRLAVAAELLETTLKSAEQVGEEVGFKSRNSFYREFKNRFGVTPLQYRKKNRQK